METDDKKIIENFLAGDDPAFDILMKKHLRAVYNFICQLTGDRTSADDITQETFLKAWKNICRFDMEKNFKTWLFAIAKNTAYDHLKKKKAIPFSKFLNEEGSSVLEEIKEDKILPDEVLNRKDLAREVERNLEKISLPYKIILNLRYKEDFELQEISKILGKPYNTIKSQHSRALNKLKEILTGSASDK